MNQNTIAVNDFTDNLIEKLPTGLSLLKDKIELLGTLHVLTNEVKNRNRSNYSNISKNITVKSEELPGLILQSIARSVAFWDNKVTRLHYILRMIGWTVIIGNKPFCLNYYDPRFYKGEYAFNLYVYTCTLYDHVSADDDNSILCSNILTKLTAKIMGELLPSLKYTVISGNLIITRTNLRNYLSFEEY